MKLKSYVAALLSLLTFTAGTPIAADTLNTPPRGWLDSCAVGWAIDFNTPERQLDVHIYVDKPAGVDNNSGFVGVASTTVVRTDVNSAFGRPATEKHGFEWTAVPRSLYDGKTHTVYAYGIDTTDGTGRSNALLDGSPKQCTWGGGVTNPSSAIQVTSPTAGEEWAVSSTHTINWTDSRGSAVGYKYTLLLEPYIACLHAVPTPCKIAQHQPYTIVEHLAASSFTWNIPSNLQSEYATSSRILVVQDNSDVYGASGVFTVATKPGAFSVGPSGTLTATVAHPFDTEFTAKGGTSPYTFGVGGSLPPGLEWKWVVPSCAQPLNGPANCPSPSYHLTGTPTAVGNYPLTITATDSTGLTVSTSVTVLVTPNGPSPIEITLPTNLTATVGQVYSGMFSLLGGESPYSWNLSSQTSSGLFLKDITFNCITTPCVNPKREVLVYGTPTVAGAYPFTISVTDSRGVSTSKSFTITVSGGSVGVRTGYVDVATNQRVEGWFYDSTKSGACVTITYKKENSSTDVFTQDACPTLTRTDAADWIRAHHGSNYTISQPLGFRADPTRVLAPGTYRVTKVTAQNADITLDLSESAKSPFTIADNTVATGPIVITSPAKGDTWQTGQAKTISWSGHNNLPVTIKLVEYRSCELSGTCPRTLPREYTIATGVTSVGHPWTIPASIIGGTYRVSIETSSAGVDYILWGQSGVFTINNGGISTSPLSVTSPAAGQVIAPGSTATIEWNVLADTQGFPVNIGYSYYAPCLDQVPACALPTTLVPIITTTSNTGSYKWQVPSNFAGKYDITVTVAGISGTSGAFTIGSTSTPDRLVVLKPTKDEVWSLGETYPIRWSPSSSGGTVTISVARYIACLHNPGAICAIAQPAPVVITSTAPDTGTYNWTIPKDFSVTGAVSVTVVNSSASRKQGESEPFQISSLTLEPTKCPVDPGTLAVGTSGTVYLITPECKKYGFISLQDFTSRGYKLIQVRRVDQALLDSIPTLPSLARPSGITFKYSGPRAVYYLDPTQCKQLYPSQTTLRAWGILARDILTIPDSETYPDCTPSFVRLPNNSWVQVAGNPTVYQVQGTVLRPYATLGALISSGFNNQRLYTIQQVEFSLYTVGNPIQ